MNVYNFTDLLDYSVLVILALIFFSSRINTGFIGTLGLGVLAVTAIADLDPTVDDTRLKVFLLIGIILILVFWLLQALAHRYTQRGRQYASARMHAHRRASDPP